MSALNHMERNSTYPKPNSAYHGRIPVTGAQGGDWRGVWHACGGGRGGWASYGGASGRCGSCDGSRGCRVGRGSRGGRCVINVVDLSALVNSFGDACSSAWGSIGLGWGCMDGAGCTLLCRGGYEGFCRCTNGSGGFRCGHTLGLLRVTGISCRRRKKTVQKIVVDARNIFQRELFHVL